MLYWLFVLIWFFCGIQILRNNGITRMCYFFVGIFFVPSVLKIIPQALLMGHTFYATTFIVSMFRFRELKLETSLSCPFFYSQFFILLASLLIGIFDFRIGVPLGLLRGITSFVSSYFLFFVGWVSLTSASQADFVSNDTSAIKEQTFFERILPLIMPILLFGVWSAFSRSNPILDAVGLNGRFFYENMDNFRSFRVTGACVSSSVYGLACATLFLCSFFLTRYRTKTMIFTMILLLVNLALSATRAAIIPFLIGLCTFIILNKNISNVAQKSIISILVLLLISPLLPHFINDFISQLLDSVMDVFLPSGSGGTKYGGSNVDAREMQIMAAFQYLKQKPFFGHGFAYFAEVISHGKKHQELLGMESYLCIIGVEYGLIYLITIIAFYVQCFIYFWRSRVYNKLYSDLGLSLITMFIPFLIFAWVGGCWFFFLPLLGYVAKAIYISKNEQIV